MPHVGNTNCCVVDWQLIANIATSIGVIVAIGALIWQIIISNREKEYVAFLKYIDVYHELSATANKTWLDIRKTVRENPATAHEIQDSTSTFDYLLQRTSQKDHLLEIEVYILESEIQRLNILNEICRFANNDPNKAVLAKALFAREIAYYKSRIAVISKLHTLVHSYRLLSTPRADALRKFEVEDFFSTNAVSRGGN